MCIRDRFSRVSKRRIVIVIVLNNVVALCVFYLLISSEIPTSYNLKITIAFLTVPTRPRRDGKVVRKEVMVMAVSYTHLRAHETPEHLVCRLLLEKKKKKKK
eukprot:TRINITY_DN563_c0_g1_i22.p1 TRINITY_DN563_c0_g1~~TRINITY_DN563_c0_g1_i22.p1  ORF type:complete len:102 (-),score=28.51 TRINITY_DN563_c0_g1_i22:101-406(-)